MYNKKRCSHPRRAELWGELVNRRRETTSDAPRPCPCRGLPLQLRAQNKESEHRWVTEGCGQVACGAVRGRWQLSRVPEASGHESRGSQCTRAGAGAIARLLEFVR